MAERHLWQHVLHYHFPLPFFPLFSIIFHPKSKVQRPLWCSSRPSFPGSLAGASITGTSSQTYSVTGCNFQAGALFVAIARWVFFQPLGERSDAANHGPVKNQVKFLSSSAAFWFSDVKKNGYFGQGSTWFFVIFWVGSPHQLMEGTEIAVFLPNLGKPAIQSPVRVDSDYNPW